MQDYHLVLFVLATLVSNSKAIDLCIFFGTCGNNNPNNARSDNNLPIPDVNNLDSEWIEPSDSGLRSNNQIYYFANNANAMNWYDADQYCIDKGGFLAEPMTSQENDFLKGYAKKYSDINWWTGLREAENCRCQATDARTVEFDANIDYDSLTRRTANGFVKTKCPSIGNYAKNCDGKVWIWSFSAIRASSFTDWNSDTDEPNGDGEHCTALWARKGNRWSDWHCNTSTFHSEATFKPLCQKDKDSLSGRDDEEENNDSNTDNSGNSGNSNGDIIIEDEENDEDGSEILPDKTECFDANVVYKSRPKDRLNNIHQVESAQLCREMCAENPECNYWSWVQKRKNKRKVCKLKSGILSTGFRRRKNKAISGTILNGCNPNSEIIEDDKRSFCLEYGAIYTGGNNKKNVRNINTLQECQQKCEQENGCKYYTLSQRKRGRICTLRFDKNFEKKYTRKATSGSVEGNCKNAPIDNFKDCECVPRQPFKQPKRPEQPNLSDILNGGSLRSSFEEDFGDESENDQIPGLQARASVRCLKNQVWSCNVDENLVTTTTPKPVERFQKGEYCVDYDVNYQEGDQFKSIRNIDSAEECRQQCLNESRCKYYVWKGNSKRKNCLLKSSGLWIPKLEQGTVSGTISGDCKFQKTDFYGFCDCVELAPDYYDEDFIDLHETGLINPKLNTCPPDQGRRCYAKTPLLSVQTSSRIFFNQ